MHVKNTLTEYGLISKLLHWISAILLLVQIPLGFYLVDLDFGPERLDIEDLHIIIGLSIFYLVILNRPLIKRRASIQHDASIYLCPLYELHCSSSHLAHFLSQLDN